MVLYINTVYIWRYADGKVTSSVYFTRLQWRLSRMDVTTPYSEKNSDVMIWSKGCNGEFLAILKANRSFRETTYYKSKNIL